MAQHRTCNGQGCQNRVRWDSATGKCLKCYKASLQAPVTAPDRLQADRDQQHTKAQISGLKKLYDESLKTITRLEYELRAVDSLREHVDVFEIPSASGSNTSNEGTAVMVASDWHVEETVGPEVGGLNVFNPTIAQQRVERFFRHGLRLIKLLQQDLTINTIVLALLGDFITGAIHDELNDLTNQLPMHALVTAQNYLISGIQFLLDHSDCKLVIPCHSGNHARTTQKTRFSVENGHSLEYLMYLHLAAYFRHEPRVTFLVSEGYHSYLKVYDTTIRFHHGHAVKYAGGVGGIYIPTNKAIDQWNKARRADLDVFGHFHQLRDGGNFLCNGSLIGYNGFALSIKADFEIPKQTLFLMDKKRGRTCTWPILLEQRK